MACCSRLMVGLVCPVLTAPGGPAAAEPGPRDLFLLDRLSWGLTLSSVMHLRAIGSERWLQEQFY